MKPALKEILRNLKRHRGAAEWREPLRQPPTGEVQGFIWEFPNRRLTLLLVADAKVQVTKDSPSLSADEPKELTIASDELETMRALYQWVASSS